jgi:hypothetical protein
VAIAYSKARGDGMDTERLDAACAMMDALGKRCDDMERADAEERIAERRADVSFNFRGTTYDTKPHMGGVAAKARGGATIFANNGADALKKLKSWEKASRDNPTTWDDYD